MFNVASNLESNERLSRLVIGIVLLIVLIDQMRTRGYFKKLYDYFFKEPQ